MQVVPRSRIAILLPDLRGGGVERTRLVLAHEFVRMGHQVEFVVMRARGELMADASAAFDVTELGGERIRQLPFLLLRYLRRRRPDVLLVAMWPLTVLAPFVSKLVSPRKRVVVSEHAMLSQGKAKGRIPDVLFRASCMLGYRLADARIAISERVADQMRTAGRLKKSQVTVIHNPFRGFPCRDGVQPPPVERRQGKIILAAGNLSSIKNYSLLVQALGLIRDRVEFTAYILGEGPERQALEGLIADLGLSDRVFLPGFQNDVGGWFEIADLFAHTAKMEGLGNVIIEALSYGVPVVCADCPGGPREILQDGKFGVLVRPDDPAALAEQIALHLRRSVSKEALKLRAQDFKVERIAGQYAEAMRIEGTGAAATGHG